MDHYAAKQRLRSIAAGLRTRDHPQLCLNRGVWLRQASESVEGDGRGHFWLAQSSDDASYIASKLPWYGPSYSPHDVPAFYDVAGITEDPVCFKRCGAAQSAAFLRKSGAREAGRQRALLAGVH